MPLPDTIAELDRRLGIPDIAQVVEGNGGLPCVRITRGETSGEIYLHGAHVTSWKPRGAEEVLFVSSRSRWEDGRAIRGGVPICFPWFADKADDSSAPAHGFVRTRAWQLDSIAQSGGAVTVSMSTRSDGSTKRWWPADFHLVYRVTFGSELSVGLVVTNTGATAARFEEALHTYFRVGQIEEARVHGLNGVSYVDKTDRNQQKTQQGAIAIVSETDRVYLNTTQAVELEDPALQRRIRLARENSHTAVVWNPWVAKSKTLSDLGDAEWRQMICIEASNVGVFAVNLPPDREHRMKATLKVVEPQIALSSGGFP
jgi:glucose-6-phosphate 1-epimerase